MRVERDNLVSWGSNVYFLSRVISEVPKNINLDYLVGVYCRMALRVP